MLLKRISIGLVLAMVMAACGGSDTSDTSTGEAATEQMDDNMSEEAIDDNMSEEAIDDNMSEEAIDDNMSEEAMDDNMSEEAMDDNMSEEAMDDNMSDGHMPTTFTVTIENTSDSTNLPTPLAPGAYAIHTGMDTLFAAGDLDRGAGLEALAEDGDPSGLVASLAVEPTVTAAGAFAIPEGGSAAGPALPGSSYSFTFEATPGGYLSFATMFVQSNDWFFAPAPSGINLFDGETPLQGDITDLVLLWDAGTEIDETPGEGTNQAPRQTGPNTGDTQEAPIDVVDGYGGALTVTISADG